MSIEHYYLSLMSSWPYYLKHKEQFKVIQHLSGRRDQQVLELNDCSFRFVDKPMDQSTDLKCRKDYSLISEDLQPFSVLNYICWGF